MTFDHTLINLAEILKKYDLGEKLKGDLPRGAVKRLKERGIIDDELRITGNGYKSIYENLRIHEFIKEKTLMNYALNYASLYDSLVNGDTSDYDKLNYVVRRNLRRRGLIKRLKVSKGWIIEPTNLWKKIIANTMT